MQIMSFGNFILRRSSRMSKSKLVFMPNLFEKIDVTCNCFLFLYVMSLVHL